jgi:hypothetical protein
MLKWKYVLLGLALVELAIGFSNARPNVFFYLGLPVGTILFILFLIFHILEKESALYDEQNRQMELARKSAQPSQRPAPGVSRQDATGPVFGQAHSH